MDVTDENMKKKKVLIAVVLATLALYLYLGTYLGF